MNYKIVLHREEEGISVSVPALPGCWSEGDTEEEALANIRDAVREYLAARQCGGVSNLTSGAELVAYWQNAGLVGSRLDIADAPGHARSIRQRAGKRSR